MSRNNATLLLLEVLRLRVKYSDKELEDVINLLKNKDRDPILVSMLELVKDLQGMYIEAPKVQKNAKQIGASLDDLMVHTQKNSPQKHAFLEQIANQLMVGNKNEVSKFVSRRFTKLDGNWTKKELIYKYISHLLEATISDLESELYDLQDFGKTQDRDVSSFLRMAEKMVKPKDNDV